MGPATGSRLGNHTILAKLGSGGTGTVYKAQQENLKRLVALKVLHAVYARNPAVLKRFKREILATASLSHPYLVKVFDAGKDGELYFYTMEYVEGRPLRALMKETGPMAPAVAVRIFIQVAEALQYVHAEGMIHRDIKPENIMLDPTNTVRLMDFGIVKVHDESVITQFGTTVGTPRYMSPEMVMGDPQDHRSDIFQLGVLMYEMLVGECPFHGETISQMAFQITDEPAPVPSSLQQNLPGSLDRIVLRCLEKAPEDRYASAADLIRDLEVLTRSGQRPTGRVPVLAAKEPRPPGVAAVVSDLQQMVRDSHASAARVMRLPRMRWSMALSGLAFVFGIMAASLATHRRPLIAVPPVVETGIAGLAVRWQTRVPTITEVELTDLEARSVRKYRSGTEALYQEHSLTIGQLRPGRRYSLRVLVGPGEATAPQIVQLPAATKLMERSPQYFVRENSSLEVVFHTTVPARARANFRRYGARMDRNLTSSPALDHRLKLERVGPEEEIRDVRVAVDAVNAHLEPPLPDVFGPVRSARELSGRIGKVSDADLEAVGGQVISLLGARDTAEDAGLEAAREAARAWMRQTGLAGPLGLVSALPPWVFGPLGAQLDVQLEACQALQRLEDLDALAAGAGRSSFLDVAGVYAPLATTVTVSAPGESTVILDNTARTPHYICRRYYRDNDQKTVRFDGHHWVSLVSQQLAGPAGTTYNGSTTNTFRVAAVRSAPFSLIFQVANCRPEIYLLLRINDRFSYRLRTARRPDGPGSGNHFQEPEALLSRSTFLKLTLPGALLNTGQNLLTVAADTAMGIAPLPATSLLRVYLKH